MTVKWFVDLDRTPSRNIPALPLVIEADSAIDAAFLAWAKRKDDRRKPLVEPAPARGEGEFNIIGRTLPERPDRPPPLLARVRVTRHN